MTTRNRADLVIHHNAPPKAPSIVARAISARRPSDHAYESGVTFTFTQNVGAIANTRALEYGPMVKVERLLNERDQVAADAFVELRIWRVPRLVPGSGHDLKYALAYVVAGLCVLRYDNEAGKSDHRHLGAMETAYGFTTLEKLLEDFWSDVDQWRPE